MNIFIDVQLLTALSQCSASTKFLSPPKLQVSVSLGAVMTVIPIFLCDWAASGPEQRKWKLNILPLACFLPWRDTSLSPSCSVQCTLLHGHWLSRRQHWIFRIFSLLFVFGKPGPIRNSPQQCSDGVAVGWETWTAMVKWLKCTCENW